MQDIYIKDDIDFIFYVMVYKNNYKYNRVRNKICIYIQYYGDFSQYFIGILFLIICFIILWRDVEKIFQECEYD